MKIDTDFITLLLDYGFIGVGILLSILMYKLLRKAQKKKNAEAQLIKLLKFYFIFALAFLIFSLVLEVVQIIKAPGVTIEVDASNSELWEGKPKEFKWFNAQYKLAKDNFITLNANNIKDGVNYQLLFFEGIDNASILNSKEKFDRMRLFLRKLSKEVHIDNEKVQVRMVKKEAVPMMSYFVTERNEKDIIIYYLDELTTEEGSPNAAFQVNDHYVYQTFKSQFDKYWHYAERLPIEKILNQNISTDVFYNKSKNDINKKNHAVF